MAGGTQSGTCQDCGSSTNSCAKYPEFCTPGPVPRMSCALREGLCLPKGQLIWDIDKGCLFYGDGETKGGLAVPKGSGEDTDVSAVSGVVNGSTLTITVTENGVPVSGNIDISSLIGGGGGTDTDVSAVSGVVNGNTLTITVVENGNSISGNIDVSSLITGGGGSVVAANTEEPVVGDGTVGAPITLINASAAQEGQVLTKDGSGNWVWVDLPELTSTNITQVTNNTTVNQVQGRSEIIADTSANAVTVDLPASPVDGFEVYVRRIGANVVTVNGNGNSIQGNASFEISSDGQGLRLVFVNGTWFAEFRATFV